MGEAESVEQSPKIKKLTDKQIGQICIKVAQADKCLTEGADEELQLVAVCSHAMKVIEGTVQ